MSRKLRNLIAAATATAALLALSAPGAQAEPTFTVPGAGAKAETTLTMLKDGAGTTAHWEIDISNAAHTQEIAVTCDEIRANEFEHDGAVTGPGGFTEVTIATPKPINCSVNGLAVKAENKGCSFTFTASGTLDIVNAGIHICEPTKEAIVASGFGCTVELGKQSLPVSYHTVKDAGTGKTVVTGEAGGVENLTYKAYGFLCPFGTTSNGVITTANAIVAGFDKGFGVAVDVSWEP